MDRERTLRFPIDLPGLGDTSPPDPGDPFEAGPWLCHVCGHESRFPYCYCERRTA